MIPVQIDFSPGSLARKQIQKEFFDNKWNQFRVWFFETYSPDDLYNIFQEFYEKCALHNNIICFVPWFITTYVPLYIKALERTYHGIDGQTITQIYPPQSSFVLPNNTSVTFTALQRLLENNVALIPFWQDLGSVRRPAPAIPRFSQ